MAAGALLVTWVATRSGRRAGSGAAGATGAVASHRVPGFGEVAFRVTGPLAGGPRRWCALVAATEAQRETGLMQRQDLAGYDAMLFLFDRPSTVAFYMKDTLIPLSVAWFDASGRYVGSATMAPCPATATPCPEFPSPAPYTVALEAPAGGLGALGVGPGAAIAVGGAC